MKIVVDIGHPAHVHYFKNLIWLMQEKGDEFLIVARNRAFIFNLLNVYNFNYIDRGRGSSNIIGKILYLPKADFLIYKIAKKFKPDLFISFGSMYAAQASKALGRPHIAFNDIEFLGAAYILYSPFTDVIFTPYCYRRELGKKQVRFNGFMELCYLHPNYFKPDQSVLEELGIEKGEKYVIVRFVSFKAIHDTGVKGFNWENKIAVVNRLSKYAKVFVNSEGELPTELDKYKFNLPPERFHDALYYSSLYVGDSGTTATEAACLGVPAIRCNTFARSPHERGNFIKLEEEYGLLLNFNVNNQEKAIEKAVDLIKQEDVKNQWGKQREKLLRDKIDVTSFIVWFIKEYPKSIEIIRENPDYQERFK